MDVVFVIARRYVMLLNLILFTLYTYKTPFTKYLVKECDTPCDVPRRRFLASVANFEDLNQLSLVHRQVCSGCFHAFSRKYKRLGEEITINHGRKMHQGFDFANVLQLEAESDVNACRRGRPPMLRLTACERSGTPKLAIAIPATTHAFIPAQTQCVKSPRG